MIAKDCSSSKRDSSCKYIYRYKYNNPLTDTIAVDSYNMLMIAISAISLSRRGVRKLPQGADVFYQPTYQQARKRFIYFITLRLIFIRLNVHGRQFCRFHVFKCGWNFSLFPQSMLKLHENGCVVSKHSVLILYFMK